MTQEFNGVRRFNRVARISYNGKISHTRIILESERSIATTLGTFILIGVRWLWVMDLECELKPEVKR